MVHRDVWLMVTLVAYLTTSFSSTKAFTVDRLYDSPQNDRFELSVIHINDFHARFEQTSVNSGTCEADSEDTCVGGIARVYTAAHQLLNERPNAIFLNAGDEYQGTLWYNFYKWNVTAKFINMLPQDAMTIGNHEFDDRIAGLIPFLEAVKVPIVVTNINDTKEPELQRLYTNSTIIDRNGTKIGVIGVILSTTNIIATTDDLTFYNEVKTVNAEAEKLKKKGVDIIIALTHCGLNVDRVIAANCSNVDLVVGGHSHTFLYSGTPPSTDVAADKYPVVVKQEDTNRTVLIVQAYAFTKYMGNLTVWFDSAGEVVDWEGNPILLDKSVEQNADVLAALAPWKESVDALGSRVIGSTRVELSGDACRFGECNLGNLITDAMVNAYVDKAENRTYWTYASVACTNVGSIHSGSEVENNGIITFNDAVSQQRYEDTWDVLELRGSDLIQVLEYSIINSYSSTQFIGIQFLQWSGIRVFFNLENEPYSRVECLKIRCRACDVPIYEDVVLDEWYRIVVPSYLANGGDGYTVIANQKRNYKVGTSDIDSYVKYIEKTSPIITGVEGRMILNGTWHG